MHRVIKKALATFERESKLPQDEKAKAQKWLEDFCAACEKQEDELALLRPIQDMLGDRLLGSLASWAKWKFSRRGKRVTGRDNDRFYEYSLGISTGTCPSCEAAHNHCSGCSLGNIGASCSPGSGVGGRSPYQIACDTGAKTPLVDALWKAVEWAIEHEEERSGRDE